MISVIIPVYNVEQYIHKCLNSVLCQTYSNLEIILVDDGSSDNCPKICDNYAEKDVRVKVIHQKNAGISVARNVALEICKGEYIAFVDSDDWLEPTAYEDMMKMMKESDLNVVFCTANVIVDNEIVGQRFEYFENGTVLSPNKMVELSLKDEIGGQVWLRICHKKCWENVRFPAGRIYEDLAVSFYPFLNAKKAIGFLRKALYNYRLNINGISLSHNPQKPYNIFLAFNEHLEYAKANFSTAESCCLSKATTHALNAYNSFLIDYQKDFDEFMKNIAEWIRKNKSDIMKCEEITLLKKTLVLLLLSSKSIYKAVYYLYKKCKG